MSRGNRFFAWSHDGGERWVDFWRSETLPDGPRGTSYGCMGGLIRLPFENRDVLLYSNLDTDLGVMPSKEQAGASRSQGRERLTVWGSFDGGSTWPIKRLVHAGPSAYSCLGVGRPGTESDGRCYVFFEGGEADRIDQIRIATFNLSWLIQGPRTGAGQVPKWAQ
jgi:sialidase-1